MKTILWSNKKKMLLKSRSDPAFTTYHGVTEFINEILLTDQSMEHRCFSAGQIIEVTIFF